MGLPLPALELLASYLVNQGILCMHINEITSIISNLLYIPILYIIYYLNVYILIDIVCL